MRITGSSGQPQIPRQTDVYTAQQGETLSFVAAKLGVLESDLASSNNLAPGAQLKLGQELNIPQTIQQSLIQHGIASMRDAFETTNKFLNDAYKQEDPTLKQTEQNAPSEVIVTDNSLQKQLEESLIQANNIFQIPKKPKIAIGPEVLILTKLSQLTGKSFAEIEALFQKHGLNPANLPNPPDAKVAALFNDPAFDSELTGLKGEVASTHQNLVEPGETSGSAMPRD